MSRYALVFSIVLGWTAAVTQAQSPAQPRSSAVAAPPGLYFGATDPSAPRLVADRERFVRDFYSPDPAAMASISGSLAEAAKLHDKYLHDVSLTLSRMSLTLGIAADNAEYDEARRSEIMQRIRLQAARLYGIGPLSLANTAKMAEGHLSADRITAGRAKLTARVTDKLAGAPLDIKRLDAWLTPPLGATPKPIIPRPAAPEFPPMGHEADVNLLETMPLPDAGKQAQPPMTERSVQMTPTTADQAARTGDAPAVPPKTDQPLAIPAPAPQPPPKPRVVKAAPPTDTWTDFARSCAAKFKYSADQQKTADGILQGVLKRAAGAGDTKDEAGNRPVDLLFDELTQRLESVASIEQRQAATASDSGKAPPTPAETPKTTGN